MSKSQNVPSCKFTRIAFVTERCAWEVSTSKDEAAQAESGGKSALADQNSEKIKDLRMGLHIVENLCGLCGSIF